MKPNKIFLILFILVTVTTKNIIADTLDIPKIEIFTNNQVINDEYIFGKLNLVSTHQNIDSLPIQIRLRGASSRMQPKKSYRIEFIKDTVSLVTQNISLLNMRSDDDWNLNAMYNEPMRINSKSAFSIWSQIFNTRNLPLSYGNQSIAIEYVQLYIDNEYIGIYILTERIDKKQLNLNEEFGQLVKTLDHSEAAKFAKAKAYNNQSNIWDGIEWKHPENKINWEDLYDLVYFVTTSKDKQFYTYISDYIDIDNFVDYYIFINLLALWDNTGKNIYIAKQDGASPFTYTPWDLDGSFGFDWSGAFITGYEGILSNGLFDRLIHDCGNNKFGTLVKKRYFELRERIITSNNIHSILEQNYQLLYQNNIYSLEVGKWEKYIFKPEYLQLMKDWIDLRIDYLDTHFAQPCISTSVTQNIFELEVSIYPNPTKNIVNISIRTDYAIPDSKMEVFSINGQHVLTSYFQSQTQLNTDQWAKGLYLIHINNGKKSTIQKLIVQ
ncbi:MAG: CotH kinase family protein [Chitinophagales bacterium]|nr:CotH kinase family protein [Chitinophagales bacterium]